MCITTHAGASEDNISSVTLGEDVYVNYEITPFSSADTNLDHGEVNVE